MDPPQVCIVIPCFNAARFLAETLDSALAQRGVDFELIAIDDGSTDTTLEILERYRRRADRPFRVETGPNRGVSAARDRGTALSRGQYLQYLDADDLLRPHALAAKVDALESSGADIAYADWQELNEVPEGQFCARGVHVRQWQSWHADPEIAVVLEFWAPPAALLYRRALVDRVGGWKTGLDFVEDGRFLFDAVHHGGRLQHVPGIGADYRRALGRNSVSTRDPAGFARNWAEDGMQVQAIWSAQGPLNEEQKRALLRRFGKTTRVLYELDRAAFWRVYAHMRELDPDYVPQLRPSIALAARIVGYPGSEALALAARRTRGCLRRAAQWMRPPRD